MDFSIKRLNKSHIEHAYDLHDFVCKSLYEIKETSLTEKSFNEIKYEIVQHITVGAFDSNNLLVGKSTLLINPSEEEREFEVLAPNHKMVGVLRSTCVHPEFQRKGVSKKIMQGVLDHCNEMLLCSTIIINNYKNLKNRIDQGFCLFQIAGNINENINVYCLIFLDKQSLGCEDRKFIHYKKIDDVIAFLNLGYIGVSVSADGVIEFIKDRQIRKYVGCLGKSNLL